MATHDERQKVKRICLFNTLNHHFNEKNISIKIDYLTRNTRKYVI